MKCWFWHKWGMWGRPEEDDFQERRCERCGKIERKYFVWA